MPRIDMFCKSRSKKWCHKHLKYFETLLKLHQSLIHESNIYRVFLKQWRQNINGLLQTAIVLDKLSQWLLLGCNPRLICRSYKGRKRDWKNWRPQGVVIWNVEDVEDAVRMRLRFSRSVCVAIDHALQGTLLSRILDCCVSPLGRRCCCCRWVGCWPCCRRTRCSCCPSCCCFSWRIPENSFSKFCCKRFNPVCDLRFQNVLLVTPLIGWAGKFCFKVLDETHNNIVRNSNQEKLYIKNLETER